MTLTEIKNRIRFFTGTDSTQYSDTNVLSSLNEAAKELVHIALSVQDACGVINDNDTTFPVATYNIIANRDHYTMPDGLLKFNRAEISYDGVIFTRSTLDEKRLINTPFNQTDLNGAYSTASPKHFLSYSAFWPLPIPTANVTSGLIIYFERTFTEYTTAQMNDATTKTGVPGIFDKYFIHYGVCDWYLGKDQKLFDRFSVEKSRETVKIEKHYSSQNNDRPLKLKNYSSNYKYR